MGDLSGVACVSSGDCWAVGTPITNGGFGSGTTTGGGVESYSGGTWTSVPSPSPTGSAWTDLSAVACASASDCWFVGDYGKESEGPDQPLVEGDDGGAWSVVSPPLPTGAVEGALSSVACQSTGDCWAVGYFSDTNGEPYQPLIEHYSAGAWTVTAGDLPAGDDNGMLSAVSCAGASDCWAVGEGSPQISDSTSALIEHYEGTGWSVAPSPAPTGASGVGAGTSLSGVTCVGVSECWAVGDQTTGGDKGGVQEPLIEQYTVGGWTIVDSPTPDDDGLVGVTCAGATECWAVGNGSVSDSGDDEPLIESYAGSSWTVVSSGTISIPSWLSAVSCSGSRDCWAVGEGVVDHYTG